MKKFLMFVLTGIITLTSFMACKTEESNEKMENEIQLWTVDSNQKITLNQEPTLSSSDELNITMVKNESESAQLVITPKQNVVYDLKASDLTCGENTISAENIEFFREHYVYVHKSYDPELVRGYYPDALVPFETAKKAGENKIRKGENQPIFVKVTTDANTPSGLYTGKVSVIVDGETFNVDLNVRVANVEMPTEVSAKTAYNILEEGNFLHGYFDESKDYYTTYYDALLEYRVNGIFIPGTQDQDASVSEWVNAIEKYAFNEKVATYCLPYKTVTVYDEEHAEQHNFFDEEKMENLLIELISRSTNEKNLLEKAYLYLTFCDEPALEQAWRIKKTDLAFYKLREKIYNIGSLYPTDGSKDEVRESLMKVYHVVTVADHDTYYPLDGNGEYVGGAEVFCPLFSDVHTNTQQNNYQFRMENGLPTWFYGCCAPTTPYPTYHIDDRGVTGRIISWMQKYYGFEGELYWGVNLTKSFNADIWKYLSIDPWYDVYTGWNDPGEGLLLYPGHKYGIDSPLGSLRMELIKDSKEDYELLSILEQELAKASETYKYDFNFQEYIQSMMDTLFYGTIVTDETNNFFNVRNEIINLIEVLQSPSQIVVTVGSGTSGAKSRIEVYAKNDIALKVNGKAAEKIQMGENYRFVYDYHMLSGANSVELSYTENGTTYTFTKYLGTGRRLFSNFNTQAEIDKLGKTDGAKEFQGVMGAPVNDTAISLNTDSAYAKTGGSLKLTYRGVANNKAYKPGIKLLGNGGTYADYSSLAKVSVDVYNPNGASMKLHLGISTKAKNGNQDTAVVITDIVELKEGWNSVTLKADGKNSLDMSKVAQINFLVENPIVENGEETVELTQTLYFENVIFSDKVDGVKEVRSFRELTVENDGFEGLYDSPYDPNKREIGEGGLIFDYEDFEKDVPYYTTLIGFDNLKAKLSLNEDERYVSHGKGSLRLDCTTGESTQAVEIWFKMPNAATNFVNKNTSVSLDIFNPMGYEMDYVFITNRLIAGYSNQIDKNVLEAKTKNTFTYNLREALAPKTEDTEVDYREDVAIWIVRIVLPPNSDITLYFDNFTVA